LASAAISAVSALKPTAPCKTLVRIAEREAELVRVAGEHGVAVVKLGTTGDDRLAIGGLDLSVSALRAAYEGGLAHALGGVTANL
jgi:hypothetical protein